LSGLAVFVKGPKGELSRVLPMALLSAQDNGLWSALRRRQRQPSSANAMGFAHPGGQHGRRGGASRFFPGKPEIIGVGYRAQSKPQAEWSAPVTATRLRSVSPEGITFSVERTTPVDVPPRFQQGAGRSMKPQESRHSFLLDPYKVKAQVRGRAQSCARPANPGKKMKDGLSFPTPNPSCLPLPRKQQTQKRHRRLRRQPQTARRQRPRLAVFRLEQRTIYAPGHRRPEAPEHPLCPPRPSEQRPARNSPRKCAPVCDASIAVGQLVAQRAPWPRASQQVRLRPRWQAVPRRVKAPLPCRPRAGSCS